MRLSEALQISRKPPPEAARSWALHLVCGFTPLHLETFILARARLRFPRENVRVLTGLFGDLEGNLTRARDSGGEGAIVVIEWSDLDRRLGLRSAAGWSAQVLDDLSLQLQESCRRLETRLAECRGSLPVAVAAPTLTLPPLTHFPPAQASPFEVQARSTVSEFLTRICSPRGVKVVSDSELAARSPFLQRHDVGLDLHTGFPYAIQHADVLAELCVECLFPKEPKKALITDLDDTLWRGILGDVGVDRVSWDLENRSQAHALYQQLLASLAESGILIAVVSKNDPALVREAFQRPDILLKASQAWPIEAGWGPKSEAVQRVLEAWNIGADGVVIVDDSPMELAEVAERFPEIDCLRFPSHDPAAIVGLIHALRSRFGRTEVREEDRLRLGSLRASATLEQARTAEVSPDFLERLGARLVLSFSEAPGDGRALELVNKTNQFNLNGRRYSEGEWRSYFQEPGAFLMTAAYEDRFGPLGRIAALAGRAQAGNVRVEVWVMSCRAFSRHIEFQMLRQLFGRFGVSRIQFAFAPTQRNDPLKEFFRRFVSYSLPEDGLDLPIAAFEHGCPALFHEVIDNWTTSETSLRNAFR